MATDNKRVKFCSMDEHLKYCRDCVMTISRTSPLVLSSCYDDKMTSYGRVLKDSKLECCMCAEILAPDVRPGMNVTIPLRSHILSLGHEQAEKETMDRMPVILQRQRTCSFLSRRIEQLWSVAWQNDVKAELYEYLRFWASLDNIRERNNFELRDRYLQLAEAKLSKYENIERLSLLELAVWKSTCLLVIESPLLDYFEVLNWSKGKWKESKGRCRSDKSIHVVVSNVALFL